MTGMPKIKYNLKFSSLGTLATLSVFGSYMYCIGQSRHRTFSTVEGSIGQNWYKLDYSNIYHHLTTLVNEALQESLVLETEAVS